MKNFYSLLRSNWKKLANAALYAVFLVLMIVVVMNKANYHVDEFFSYGGANQIGGNGPIIEEGTTYKPSSIPFDMCVMVDEGERFVYGEVWNNQSLFSVHPPLFHAILHTICSFFPGTFSKWYAASINLVFALLTLYAVRKLAFLLTDDSRLVFAVSLLFIFSAGIAEAVSFFRMYVMAMFWVTLLEVLVLSAIEKEKLSASFFIKLFLIAVAGALTHYYCIIFTTLICAVYCVLLMLKKRWKAIAAFCATGAVSAATAFAIFPAMLKHVLSSERGVQTRENLGHAFSEWLDKNTMLYWIVDHQIFGDLFQTLVTGAAIVLAFVGIRTWCGRLMHKGTDGENRACGSTGVFAEKVLLVALPSVVYFLFVSKSAPFTADRYMFPIYGVAICGTFGILFAALKKAVPAKPILYIVVALIAAVTLRNEWRNPILDYLYRSSIPLLEEAKQHADTDCLIVCDGEWKIPPTYLEVKNYNSLTFLKNDNLDMLTEMEIAHRAELMVLVDDVPEREAYLERIMELCPQFSGYEEIGMYEYLYTYRLYS